MSQYVSRIHIKVKEAKIWEKLENIKVEEYGFCCSAKELFNERNQDFVIDGDWSITEQKLTYFVCVIASALGNDGIVIADTTNINVDPYTFCAYSKGCNVKTKVFGTNSKNAEMIHETNINNIAEWLNFGKFRFNDEEKSQLNALGLEGLLSNTKRKIKK
ncbi:MAG: hypothetical protein HDT13_03215 [Butyrivibrio sp.]|nr:hypothetical protein [Butyrivibrio sp.]